MRKLIEQCPACKGDLVVTQQACMDCGTTIVGQFEPNIFSKLSPENLTFLELFIKNKGNVKEMERESGMSYWTIRNRLNEILDELGFENKDIDPAISPGKLKSSRQKILKRLEKGEIDADEATDLIKQLKPS
jgi:hypothetical protein